MARTVGKNAVSAFFVGNFPAALSQEFSSDPNPQYLGARLRGSTATQRSKKGSEKVLERVLGKGSQKGCTNGRRTAVQMGGVLLGFPFFKA